MDLPHDALMTGGDAVFSVNPANGKMIARYPYLSEAELDRSLTAAVSGQRAWADLPVDARARTIAALAGVLRRDVHELASIATAEMGKPITQARAEVEKCAAMCDWYAAHGEAILHDEKTQIGEQAYVSWLPIGVILAVMPWNFPYWQVLRGAIPILAGGNDYLLKHAPNVMGCAYALARRFDEVGLPRGAFTAVNLTNDLVSAALRDRRIAALTVTGSARAGATLAAQAGAALKKSVLELGGSDPFIVLADADLDAAVKAAVTARFQNTGQICIAATRIIVEAPVMEAFTERFVNAVDALKVGDPLDEQVYLGPMARADLREQLNRQVEASIAQGARSLRGGHRMEGPGNYYAPTVLADVQPGMTVFTQETFGPVASLIESRDADHAIDLANDSEFGLSGALWTRNSTLAKKLARRIETGGVFINGFPASDPRVPIGGVKKSGYGRDLSYFGVLEFMNAQTVWFDRR